MTDATIQQLVDEEAKLCKMVADLQLSLNIIKDKLELVQFNISQALLDREKEFRKCRPT